jgi:hypothetical protein
MPKIKNIIIFLVIGAIFVAIYVFYIRSSAPTPDLVSSTTTTAPIAPSALVSSTGAVDEDGTVAREFLNLLLSVKSIKLNDTIFSDVAFKSLHDSTITLIPDGNEGRPNPFATLGNDIATPQPTTPANPITPTTQTTPALPTESTPSSTTPPASNPKAPTPAGPTTTQKTKTPSSTNN